MHTSRCTGANSCTKQLFIHLIRICQPHQHTETPLSAHHANNSVPTALPRLPVGPVTGRQGLCYNQSRGKRNAKGYWGSEMSTSTLQLLQTSSPLATRMLNNLTRNTPTYKHHDCRLLMAHRQPAGAMQALLSWPGTQGRQQPLDCSTRTLCFTARSHNGPALPAQSAVCTVGMQEVRHTKTSIPNTQGGSRPITFQAQSARPRPC